MGRRIILLDLAARAWPKFLRTNVFSAGTRLMSSVWMPFDTNKTYKVTAKLRRGASADGTCYVGVLLRRADGSYITGDQIGMFIVAPSGAAYTPGTSWATITRTFGFGTGRTFPASAVSMAPFFYVGHGQTVAHHDIRECWIEDTATPDVPISTDPYLLDLTRWTRVPQNHAVTSDDFTNAGWSKFSVSISSNVDAGPYGDNLADKLIEAAATPVSPFFSMNRGITTGAPAGTDFTFSIFAKAAERGFVNLRVDDADGTVQVGFNLTTGAAGTPVTTGVVWSHMGSGAVNVGNGWWRVWVAGRKTTAPTSVGVKVRIAQGVSSTTTDLQWAGDGTSGILIYGAQIDRGLGMGPFFPVGASILSGVLGDSTYSHRALVGSEFVPTTLRFSTHGYVSRPTDTPASATYAGRVLQPGLLRCDLPPEGFGATSMQYGEVVLANGDGALSELPYLGLDGQTATIRWGDEDAALSSFTTIAVATMEQATVDARTARIRLRSLDALLDRQHLTTRYLGNNSLPAGLEGGSELAGRLKPRAYGIVSAVEPVLVNTSRNIYQVNSTSDNTDVPIVWVAGVALTIGAAYTSQSDMETNAPGAGTYRVWSGASGTFFRLGTAAAGIVLCNVSVLPSGSSYDNPWQVIYDAAEDAGITAAQMFAARSASVALPDNHPFAGHVYGGVYVDDERTTRDVVAELARQVGGWVGFVPMDGISGVPKLAFEYWPGAVAGLTSNDEAARLFDSSMILDATAIADPGPGRGVPVWSAEVRFAAKQRTLTQAEAPSLSAASWLLEWQPFTVYTWTDSAIKDKHPTARAIVHDAGAMNVGDIAKRLLEVWRHPRLWFDVRLPLDAVLHPVRAFRPRLGGYLFLRWPQLRYLKNDGVERSEGWFFITSIETDLARGEVRLRVRQAVEDVI